MFGFLKRLLGGASAAAAQQTAAVEIRPEDLDRPDLLGPKLAGHARLRPDVAGAEYDSGIGAVKLRYKSGGEGTMFLGNALPFLRQAQGGQAMADYLDNAFAEPEAADQGYLLPVLKGADYVDNVMAQLRAAGAPEDQKVPFWYQQLGSGLMVMLVRDTPNRMISLSEEDLAKAGLDENAARQQAMADLVRFCDDRELRISPRADDRLMQLELDGNYDSSTYFLSGIWDSFAAEMGAPPAALFAARNLVLYADSSDPVAMRVLGLIAGPETEPPPHAIAPHQILIWTDEGWTTHHADPAPQGQTH